MSTSHEMPVRILGIETSCDETAAAVVENGKEIISSVVASQEKMHAQYGGVFPEMASRQHILAIHPVIQQALKEAHLDLRQVDAIAVTQGPGLPGSLVVGINAAKGLALGSGLPLIGVNHLEGHLYSAFLNHTPGEAAPAPEFPLVALIVSGGHTELVFMPGHLTYQHLGSTLDDAAGEAFDKVARLLEIGYPGGPAVQRAAEVGSPMAYHFPRALLTGTWNFSFSGLKTAVLRQVRSLKESGSPVPIGDLAASFQNAVVEVLVIKTLAAAETYKAKAVVVAGGVSANTELRRQLALRSALPVFIPPLALCTDNAAMIAAAGYHRYLRLRAAPGGLEHAHPSLRFDALPNYPLAEVL